MSEQVLIQAFCKMPIFLMVTIYHDTISSENINRDINK